MKGLVVAKKYEHVYVEIRLHRNLKYFDDQKKIENDKNARLIQKMLR
jgi:Holliday junction resolvase-like predicted endonuclease